MGGRISSWLWSLQRNVRGENSPERGLNRPQRDHLRLETFPHQWFSYAIELETKKSRTRSLADREKEEKDADGEVNGYSGIPG